jgi:hypothetical protein
MLVCQLVSSPPSPDLQVNIPGVTSKTRIADLTVEQYLELVSQTSVQLFAFRPRPDPQQLAQAVQQVRDVIVQQQGNPTLGEAIRATQQSILGQFPNIVQPASPPGAPRAVGASPAVNPIPKAR